jgi:hypothetical protein
MEYIVLHKISLNLINGFTNTTHELTLDAINVNLVLEQE